MALVLLAAAMGAYNKLEAFPRAEAGSLAALAGAMLAAAVLVAQQPPSMS